MVWSSDLTALATDRGPALVGYAYLLTGDLDRAEDLVQDALLRTYGRPRTSDGVEWAEAYVRRVILNTFLDAYRRDRAWGRVRHLFATRSDDDLSPHADQLSTRTADRVDVQAALQTLPPRERACVVLRYYDDLTVPALAQRLGLSEGAAKRYLSDAVRRLEGVLGPLPDASETQPDDAEHVELTRTSSRHATNRSAR